MTDPEAFQDALVGGLKALGLSCTSAHIAGLWRHFELLREANAATNLTRITDPQDAAVRHFADSLALAARLRDRREEPLQVLDVGTGGGFPGLPLAVVCPAWQVTCIDGTQRKIACVSGFIAEMGLGNCRARHVRADHWKDAGHFDVVAFRAVGDDAECLRNARQTAAPGASVVCYRSGASSAPPTLTAGLRRHFTHLDDWAYTLPCADEIFSRHLRFYVRH